MTIESESELRNLMRIGQICAMTLEHMLARVEPGMTTAQLDAIGAAFLKQHGARSAPILAYRFPGHTCISLNDEAAHGIPGKRVIQPGDVINVDVSAELEGFWADCGASALVPPATPEHERLLDATRKARDRAIAAAREGRPINVIGRAVEKVARETSFNVILELNGHGVGRNIHEPPTVHNFYLKRARQRLAPGMVITIEPFLTPGVGHVYTARDGWTLRTRDGAIPAQYEHTVVIDGDKPIIVTAA
ncbi:MAG: type I methionyl aminopeptidase [Chloroflexi bacterium]|nr:type I methionyl aminopeptidase [Chloroflexota bacterium]